MKAFKINNKYDKLNTILKVCDKIRKSALFKNYDKIFYHAEDKVVFATNGTVLLIYKTDRIVENLGDVGNGELTVFKDYVIFDNCDNLIDYKKALAMHKPDSELIVNFPTPLKPAHGVAIMQLALLGITTSIRVMKYMDDIADDLDVVDYDSKNNEGVFVFHNLENTLKYVAIPCRMEKWDSMALTKD